MTVPKQRHTKSRRNKRRGNIYITAATLTACPKCGKPSLPHIVCSNCGYYKGKEAIDVLKKLDKKEKKQREKEMAGKEAEKEGKKSLSMEGLSKK
ncbi:MAG: 50S ribosomal protein L32 [Candidatus Nealsonbacteria bacterium]|nr:50S ribosomal protein L32 [Candidatus Nealsonbacteria bacterium]